MVIISKIKDGGYEIKRSKNILTEKEMELVSLLTVKPQKRGGYINKLKNLFAEQPDKC